MSTAQEKIAHLDLQERKKSGRNRSIFFVLCFILLGMLVALYVVYYKFLEPYVAKIEYEDGKIGDIKTFKKNFENITPIITVMLSLVPLYVLLANPLSQTVKGSPLNNLTLLSRIVRLILGFSTVVLSLLVPSIILKLQPYAKYLKKSPERYVQISTFVGLSVLIALNIVALRSTIGSVGVMIMFAPKLFTAFSALLAGGGAIAVQNVLLGTPSDSVTKEDVIDIVREALAKEQSVASDASDASSSSQGASS